MVDPLQARRQVDTRRLQQQQHCSVLSRRYIMSLQRARIFHTRRPTTAYRQRRLMPLYCQSFRIYPSVGSTRRSHFSPASEISTVNNQNGRTQ